MIKNLYTVKFQDELVIAAASFEDAIQTLKSALKFQEVDLDPSMISLSIVNSPEDLPASWDTKCLPYGTHNEMTIGQFLGDINV